MHIHRRFVPVFVFALFTLSFGARAASAGPILVDATTANSFVQTWINTNPDNPLGPFNAVAFEFVSQSPVQTEFEAVAVTGTNGWTLTGGADDLYFAAGPSGSMIAFNLTFFGSLTDEVRWNIWYYLNGSALGGAQYQGFGDARNTPYAFVALEAESAPSIVPEPASLSLLATGVVGMALRRFRRTGHRRARA